MARLITESKGSVLEVCQELCVADTFLRRLRGLLGTRVLAPTAGLMIVPCNSVHTFFMRYPIDVVFIDNDGVIVDVVSEVAPNKMLWPRFAAKKTIELSAGSVARLGLSKGMRLQCQ